MSIMRVEKKKDYTVMNRTALNDKRLSWKAKGIIAYMLSMPDDWVFYMEELMTHATDGERSFRSGFDELKKNGYVKRFPIYENRKVARWETVVYETPQKDDEALEPPILCCSVHVQSEDVQNVHVQNAGLLSTDINQVLNKPSTDRKGNVVQKQDDDMAIPYELIISYLNQTAGTSYRHTSKKTRQLIKARFNEGFTEDDFRLVIEKKVTTWLHDSKMHTYLRPETLFGTKFEGYLNEKVGGKYGTNSNAEVPREYEDGINF
ncbi:conserved phage C-terminal domain-containing protein [Lysinibacillus fusiformis]|uniref:conserved phage C-terminal domain-containing protein n=1 Tax=Lysinibacillus fusiformis TaxID=28031 RepID=UPI003D03E64F